MNFLSNIFSGLGNLIKPITSMFSGGGNQGGGNFLSQIGSSMFGGGPQNIGGGNSTYGNNNIPTGFPKQSGGNTGWMGSLFPGGSGQGIAGMAAPFIGNMFAPKVKQPDFGGLQSVKAMQSFKPGQSVSPEYQTMLQNNTD